MSTQLPRLEARVSATESKIDARFDKIEANMATKGDIATIKEDMATMDGRILDAFKQLLTMIDSRLPPPKE